MFGCCISGAMMTHLGQRSTVICLLPLGILSWVFLFLARAELTLIALRILQGIVHGTLVNCSHNYVGEMAHPSIRGTLSSLVDLFRNLGQVYISVLGSTSLSWRTASLICGISSMLPPLIGILFLPHSPRWLILKNRKDEAHNALTFYRGQKYNVDEELAAIEEDVKKDRNIKLIQQVKKLIEPKYLKQLLTLTMLHILSMFCGNGVFIVYSTSIFDLIEIASFSSYLGTILSNAMRIIGLFLFIFISDKFSRRMLTIIFAILSGVCMAIVGIFFYLKIYNYDVSSIYFLPVVSIILFNCFTSITFTNMMIIRIELLSTNVRAVGTAFLQTIFYISTFITVYCYPYMIEYIGPYLTFWFYSLCSFLIAFVVIFFVSETRGRSLEDISKSNFKQKTFHKKRTYIIN